MSNAIKSEYKEQKEKDKLAYEFNAFTENLDIVQKFNENRILTSEYKADGSKRDEIEEGYVVICDNAGNVVVM
jgi:hypothetical protein